MPHGNGRRIHNDVHEQGRTLGFCDHVPRDEYGMVKKGGRAVRHFMIDGKVYKTKKKFLEAIKDFNP